MPDLTTVCEQLQSTFGAEGAARIVRRMARVPAAWRALQHPTLLERATQLEEAEITPAKVGHMALTLDPEPNELEPLELAPLPAIATRAIEWESLATETQSQDEAIEQIAGDKRSMQSVVACALWEPGAAEWLGRILASEQPGIRAVGINALLANACTDEAVEILIRQPAEQITQLLADLLEQGETRVAGRLAECLSTEAAPEGAKEMSRPQDDLTAALAKRAIGKQTEAQESVDRAWESALAAMASIADQLAEIASDSGDTVLAVQARQRALDTLPTPRRRAEASRALQAAGDPEGAARILANPAQSAEEAIAAAGAQLALAQTEQAADSLQQASAFEAPLDPTWTTELVDGWLALGRTDQALHSSQAGVRQHPANLELRAQLANLCLTAADPAGALEQAALLHAAEATPEHKRLLAAALQAAGQHEKALPHWLQLAEDDESVRAQVIDAALAAKDVSTALAFAQKMIEADPSSSVGRIAMGRSLIAAGNHQAGQAHLQQAVELAPQQPAVWLALADSQAKSGDVDSAGETLASAAQSCPDSPQVHARHAHWLREQERWTDALAAVEKARALDPDHVEYMSLHGSVLFQLGRHEACQPVLESAVAARPSNYSDRITLADSYGQVGALDQALGMLNDLPDSAPAAAHALRAQFSLRAAGVNADESVGEQAIEWLENARAAGYRSEDLAYWYGRAYQAAARPADAIQAYQECLKSLPEAAAELRQKCLRGEAEAAISAGQIPVAISVLERARDAGQMEPKTLSLLASAYLQAGLPAEAFTPALEACQQAPDDPQVQQQFIDAAVAAGKHAAALDKVEEWTAKEPTAELLLRKAELQYQLDLASQARSSVGHALSLDRRNVDSLRAAASLLMDHGEAQAATRILSAAERLSPNQPDLLRQQAAAADLAGDFERTRQAWTKLLEIDPESIDALVGAARAHWQTDQRSTAIGFLQRAVTLSPDSADLQAGLARLQLANGETVQALNHFRTAVELTPQDQDLSLEVAHAFLENSAPAEALEVLQASEADVTDVEHATTLAEAYLELGQPQDASVTLRRLSNPAADLVAASQLALAESAQENPEAAQEWFDKACSQAINSTRQAAWLARAALHLGRWQQASDAFSSLESERWTVETLLAAWMTATRTADAYWLFAEAGQASQHAPDASVVDVDQRQLCAGWIESLAAAGTPPSTIAALQQRTALAFDPIPNELGFDRASLPNSSRLRLHAAEGYALAQIRSGDPERALRILAETRDPIHTGRWGALLAGLAHTQMGNYSMARKAFGAVAKDALLRPLAALLAGETWIAEGRTSEAINNINTAVLAWPDEPRWQRRLAELYLADGRPEAALPHLQQALEIEPEHAEARLNLARALRDAGQITESQAAFGKALPLHPADAGVLVEAAEIDLAAGHPKLAGDRFRQALDHQPKNAAARVGAARAALALGDERAAERHAAAALRAHPTEPRVLLALGDVLAQQGKSTQALAMYDDARAQGNCPPAIERARGQLLLKMGRSQEAIESLNAIVRSNPDDDGAWAALAEAYAAAAQPGQAIDAVRMALDIRPGIKRYRLQLARYFRETGQLDQSLSELTELEATSPQDHQVAFEMGCVHQARRQFDKALGAFERAIGLRADNASAHYQAGLVLKSLKAYGRAADMLQRAVELNPQDSEALHQLAAVQALALVHGKANATAVTL